MMPERPRRGTQARENVAPLLVKYHQYPAQQTKARETALTEVTTMIRHPEDRASDAGMCSIPRFRP